MTAVVGWLLLALGLVLLPRPRNGRDAARGVDVRGADGGAPDGELADDRADGSGRRAVETGSPRRARAPADPRVLRALAAAAAAVLGVGIGGVAIGPVVAVVLAPLAWLGAARLQQRVAHARDPTVPLALDLAAAALRAGLTVPAALAIAAPAANERTADLLGRVARLLELGAEPDEAWAPVAADVWLAPVATAGRRSAASGARLAAALEQSAAELRAAGRSAALARAHRAGSLAVAPLGLCFLPAFVCLGIVPVVVGLARGMPGSLL